MTLAISVFIVTLNEADRIGRTISAVADLAGEVVVVDSGSSDATCDIAASLGARVVHNDWPGYGAQKNVAQDLCRYPWVFNLDADEVVTEALKAEIRQLFEAGEPPDDAYIVKIVDVIPGDSKPRPLAYTYHRIRLYRQDKGRFSLSEVHDVVNLLPDTRVGRLNGRVQHFSMRNLGQEIAKFNAYSDAQVADMNRRGVKIPGWRLFAEFPLAFLKAFIGRKHFMGGRYGFLIAMNYAIFRHLRVAKLYESRRRARQSDPASNGLR